MGRTADATLQPADCPRYQFFNSTEASFIEAACERLIPSDATGLGAGAIGIAWYLDAHLAGMWGQGGVLYRSGSRQVGSPGQARQWKTPADLFHTVLSAVQVDLAQRGPRFEELPVAQQDAYLATLESETSSIGPGTAVFFEALLRMTAEGYFADPSASSRRNRVPWPVRGYAGTFAPLPG